ncbi:ion channel protein Tsx [Marinobacterium nitratireducens]|uniref:Ion channel protein Tsx n=1 Tax=Marinobacterium nitratireducens TaxID=518897 RepID=A0A918DYF0_9GAMM|nr:outer membrane protein OmpK [Marinobacterium nitratireducens]GGO88363.1 ion channel protein Tsx [Marinobacterium nitratireducens]
MTAKKTVSALALVCALPLTTPANAELIWSDFSLSYLHGEDYEVIAPDGEMDTVTFEHASGHSWGDTFLFVDRLMPGKADSETYGEFSPRLSLSSVTDRSLSLGPVSDVLLAGTWEFGEGFDNYLYGLGFAIDVPGFRYFNVNLYKASNDVWDNDEQLTLTWGYPFTLGTADFLIDGFLDWSSRSDSNASEMNFTPQLKWNAGKHLGLKQPLYVGIEYSHWNNKFGIQNRDERNASLLLKWHF